MALISKEDLLTKFETGALLFQPEVKRIIKIQPEVDAEPVRRGRWIGGELGECSVCGHVGCASDIWTGCEYFYCPNCGAKMEVNDGTLV